MKIKFLFALMFVFAAIAVQAQSFVTPDVAVSTLQTTATSLENGTANINNLPGVANNTVTGTSANLGGMSIVDVTTFIYPQLMYLTSKEIENANNTVMGIQAAEAFMVAQGSSASPAREQVVGDAFLYIRDLLSI